MTRDELKELGFREFQITNDDFFMINEISDIDEHLYLCTDLYTDCGGDFKVELFDQPHYEFSGYNEVMDYLIWLKVDFKKIWTN